MTEQQDPRYVVGNNIQEDYVAYLFYLKGSPDRPAAGFMEVDGDLAYYDFRLGVSGSTLADATGHNTWQEFMENNLDIEDGPDVLIATLERVTDIDPYTGLSIQMIRDAAMFWLLTEAMRDASEDKMRAIAQYLGGYA